MSTRKTLGSLLVRLGMTDREAAKAIKEFEKKLRTLQKNVESIGQKMSIGFTAPFILAARKGIEEYDKTAQAQRRLEIATGGATKRLTEQAQALAKVTLYQDDQILSNQAMLAVMPLTEQQIIDTTNAAVQLASAFDMELDQAFQALAKTWTGSHGQLGKLIPGFKSITAEQLKAGDAIKYINTQYKGFAEEATKVGSGPLQMMDKSFNDLYETFGRLIMPMVTEVTQRVKNMADAFMALPEGTQQSIVKLAAFAALAGPVALLASKVVTLSKAFLELATSIKAVSVLKVGIAGAVAYGIGQLGDGLKGYDDPASKEAMNKAYASEMRSAVIAGDQSKINQLNMHKMLNGFFDLIQGNIGDASATLGSTDNLSGFTNRGGLGGRTPGQALAAQKKLDSSFEELANTVQETTTHLVEFSDTFLSRSDMVSTFDDRPGGWGEVARSASLLGSRAIGSRGQDMDQELAGMSLFGTTDIRSIEEQMAAISPDLSFMDQQGERLRQLADNWSFLGQAVTASIGIMGENLRSGESFMASFAKGALAAAAEFVRAKLIESAASNFKWWVEKFGPLGIPLGIASIAAGTAALQGIVSSMSTPKFAKGAVVFGPTVATVGDNPNSHVDPEVVQPLSHLKGMMRDLMKGFGGSSTSESIIYGDHIMMVASRAQERGLRRGSGNVILF